MKAIVCTAYGSPDVLHVSDIDKPEPKEGEILIRIVASSITTADSMMRTGTPYFGRLFLGLLKPKYPVSGTGLAGVVESVGSQVQRFKVGDNVFGESIFGSGTNAEFACVPAEGVIERMPENISFAEAAPACDGALTAFNFLTAIGDIKAGQKILIIGASGSLGTSAVQLAKYFGANVTGVCSSANIDLVSSLGANQVIDYTTTEFTKMGIQYDLIFDTIGSRTYRQCRNSLTKNGRYLSPVLSLPLLFQSLFTKLFGQRKALFSATGLLPTAQLRQMLANVKDLLSHGQLVTVIDSSFELQNAAHAHRYVDTGRKRGNVVLMG